MSGPSGTSFRGASSSPEAGELRYRRATAKDASAIRILIFRVGINPRGLDWRRFLLAVNAQDRVIGCGQVKPHPDGSRELASIAVRERMRRKGVASELIRKLMMENDPPLWLMCRSGLAGFYERFGFVTVEDPSLMPRYFQRVRRLILIAERLIPQEGRLAVMVWKTNKPGF